MILINGTKPLDIFKIGGVEIQKAIVQDLFGMGSVQIINEDDLEDKGGLGLGVWGSITLGDANGTKYKKSGKEFELAQLTIPCCIVDASSSNNIVKTEIQGGTRRGTVKEYISQGDYVITIKGILSNDDDQWPDTLVTQLHEFTKANISIPVVNKLLGKLQIDRLVIDSIKWPSKQGFKNIQMFELGCISDEDVEFTYYEEKKLNETK